MVTLERLISSLTKTLYVVTIADRSAE